MPRPWWLDPTAPIPVDRSRPWYARDPLVFRILWLLLGLALIATFVVGIIATARNGARDWGYSLLPVIWLAGMFWQQRRRSRARQFQDEI